MSRSTQSLLSSTICRVAVAILLVAALGVLTIGCGQEDSGRPAAAPAAKEAAAPPAPAAKAGPPTPDDLPNSLVLALAQFGARKPGAPPKPLPATLEFLTRKGGAWVVSSIDDADSNVFHKAMLYVMPDGSERLLSAAGSAATLDLRTPGEAAPQTIWEKDFGGKFSRMRDIEVGDIYGDGRRVIVIATHDQGIVALAVPGEDGAFAIEEIDQEPNTFVHEIELGDLDGDGVLEAYATPSEPNRLDGTPQSGRVVRYVPAKGEGRVVVADLGDRHAKEIFVDDVDGDGRDELYVIVEGHVEKETQRIIHPVEIRRYEAGTDPTAGAIVAEIEDRLGRFLTAGDLDGDGKKELVAALFSSGLWLLRPGDDPNGPWKKSSIDRDSGGFEHAAIVTDLDGDGRDELYVASDNDSEVRRYVWYEGKLVREVIYARTNGNSVFTWNIMPVPAGLVPQP
jgi:hypothetical protein